MYLYQIHCSVVDRTYKQSIFPTQALGLIFYHTRITRHYFLSSSSSQISISGHGINITTTVMISLTQGMLFDIKLSPQSSGLIPFAWSFL